MYSSVKRTCSTRPISKQAGLMAPGASKAPGIDERFTRVGDKLTESLDWPAPFGSSSSGEYECTGCLIPLFLFPP
jgi:hypothetical protein